jgi:hypothetical protein
LRNKLSSRLAQQVAVRAQLADLDISMPEIDGELKSIKRELGATFDVSMPRSLTWYPLPLPNSALTYACLMPSLGYRRQAM